MNSLGAYVCPEHAGGGQGDRARKGQNARYCVHAGVMRLRRPPAAPAIVARPLWVRRYPVSYGFVVPSDRNGQLYAGLSLIRSSSVPACSTFAPGHTSRPVGCGAGLYCFVPRLPVSDGEFLACPADRGSRLFRRRQLRVPPFPW